MDLSTLQAELPWTDRFNADFQNNAEIIKDFRHALDHLDMRLGDLRKHVHAIEHSTTLQGSPMADARAWARIEQEAIGVMVSQLVVFAARLAQTWPTPIDLDSWVRRELDIRLQHAKLGL